MIYVNFNKIKVSKLGFGTMRLPLNEDKSINQKQVEEMVDLAIKNGVNYFDTAFPYHEGLSEISIGKALKKYPRESFYLADKFPGHQYAENYNPSKTFNRQLEKCQVDYFDFYLLHNVYENDIQVYENPKYQIIKTFIDLKKQGKIKFLGFSSHASVECLKSFLDAHPNTFDFVQIQLNYLDATLQEADKKVELLNNYNLPIIVMEPLRGGMLATFDNFANNQLLLHRPNNSIASWAFNYLLNQKGILTILSGMSSLEQMKDNLKTFNENKPLSLKEEKLIKEIAEKLLNRVPCTKCHYCLSSCPKQLDIPTLIATYNDLKLDKRVNSIMYLDALEAEKWPSACLNCGACKAICPQKIDIPNIMKELDNMIQEMPRWKDICKQRALANKKNGD